VGLLSTTINSCTDTTTQIVIIYPTPEVIFTASNTSGCDSLNVLFTNNSNPFNGENITSMTFEWLVDGSSVSSNTDINYIFTNNTVNDVIYEVKLNGWTSHGCIESNTMYITIHPDPLADIDTAIGISTTNCAPFTIDPTVINAVLYSNANDTYYWYIEDSTGILTPYNTTGTTPPTMLMANDDYWVTIYLVTNNVHLCTADTAFVTFTTVPDPVAIFDTTNLNGCHPFQPNIDSWSDPGLTHSWFIDGVQYFPSPTDTILDYVYTFVLCTYIHYIYIYIYMTRARDPKQFF
jgi:hypothetical protein